MEDLTKRELEILFHTLGLNYKDEPFRNHFVAGENHHDMNIIKSLVDKKMMCTAKNFIGSYYFVSDSVIPELVNLKEESKPKLTRSQRRYQLYLHCESEETYGEWLKNKYWNDARKRNHAS